MLLNPKEQVNDTFLKLNSSFGEIFGKPSITPNNNSGDVSDYKTDMDRLNLPGTSGIVTPVNHTSVCPWPSVCGCIGMPYVDSE
jgi:hypothetical protein